MTKLMATATSQTMDSDDFLEVIFLNENRCQDEGFSEGQVDGRRKGLREGHQLGCRKGCEIGAELGFYLGFAEALQERAVTSKNKTRILKAIKNLSQMVQSFPLSDLKNESFQEKIQAVRAKFKQVTSLLAIQTQYLPEEIVHGISF